MTKMKIKSCSYKDCSSKSTDNEEVLFFNFPIKEQRAHKWIEACNNDLVLKNRTLKTLAATYYVCSKHFISRDFTKMYSPFKTKLKPDSIPMIHIETLSPIQGLLRERKNDHKETVKRKFDDISPPIQSPKICDEILEYKFKYNLEAFAQEMAATETRRKSRLKIVDTSDEDVNYDKSPSLNSIEEELPLNQEMDDKKSTTDSKPENQPDSDGCGSSFCSHYIALIEEKARNYKLTRRIEELEDKILCLEELLQPSMELVNDDVDIKEESIDGDEASECSSIIDDDSANSDSHVIVHPEDDDESVVVVEEEDYNYLIIDSPNKENTDDKSSTNNEVIIDNRKSLPDERKVPVMKQTDLNVCQSVNKSSTNSLYDIPVVTTEKEDKMGTIEARPTEVSTPYENVRLESPTVNTTEEAKDLGNGSDVEMIQIDEIEESSYYESSKDNQERIVQILPT